MAAEGVRGAAAGEFAAPCVAPPGPRASAARPLTPPVCADAPEFEIDFINEPDPRMSDLGARGVGEIGIVGVPAAVANAIFHATGKRVRDLPITLDKLI